MNVITKLYRTMRVSLTRDGDFENYYGGLLSEQLNGSPTAAEARRDFEASRGPVRNCFLF